MLHGRSLVTLTIFIGLTAAELTIFSDGWVPITRDQVYNNVNEKIVVNNNILQEETENEIRATHRKAKSYEVEETYDSQDAEDDSKEIIGYDYSPPAPQNSNYSSTLMNILLKYNIKTGDELQNYNLSRQPKVVTPLFHPARLRAYNNQNHLPVDPLVAVFLSNYGFYIPNLYGIKSNYNNLYGYLASNNLHNNRPFGLYKIFSDTDSSN